VIIQRRGNQLLFIKQTDHAALAATIMSHWQLGGLAEHSRRDVILEATRVHDDGWREEDLQLHVDEHGEALDFIEVPGEVKRRIWPRATARLGTTSPYVGALVAEHALTIYASLHADPQWRGFFSDMTRTRDDLVARAAAQGTVALDRDYPFVRIGDQLSLVFCNGWTAPMAGLGYRAILKDITLEVTPDPFGGKRIPISVEARTLAARRYSSAEDLRAAYAAASLMRLDGLVAGT
jgi:Protein of unknown function (DUF3891)